MHTRATFCTAAGELFLYLVVRRAATDKRYGDVVLSRTYRLRSSHISEQVFHNLYAVSVGIALASSVKKSILNVRDMRSNSGQEGRGLLKL